MVRRRLEQALARRHQCIRRKRGSRVSGQHLRIRSILDPSLLSNRDQDHFITALLVVATPQDSFEGGPRSGSQDGVKPPSIAPSTEV